MPNMGYIEPPLAKRRRPSSVADGAVESMAELLQRGENQWVSDNVTYGDRKKAVARSQAYRRATADVLDLAPALIKSRVWPTPDGKFQFALRKELS